MMAADTDAHYLPHGTPLFTRAGVMHGLKSTLTYAPGAVVFGCTAGALAAKAGLSLPLTIYMNAFVYAGASQLAALAHWPAQWTLPKFLVILLIVIAVNARFILMGASLFPYFRHARKRFNTLLLGLSTDLSWILFLRHADDRHARSERPDFGYLVGLIVPLWCVWTLAAIPGWLFGARTESLQRYGLDLFMLVFFSSLLVPMWKGAKPARPWLVAGVSALVAHLLIDGPFYIIIGTLSGALFAAVVEE